MCSQNEYLRVTRQTYLKARTWKEKPQFLDEYCPDTGQPREYVIRETHKAVPKPNQKLVPHLVRNYMIQLPHVELAPQMI